MALSSAMNIIRAAHKYEMFQKGDKVLVAVSGGPDSVVLLHALHTLSNELGITLHIAHLNHGIRGEQSDLDELFVQKLAQQLGIGVTSRKVDIPSIKLEMKVGEEEAARAVRYKFLQETYTTIGASKIAIGHNADDRAESVLLNILRGTGIDGLGSIRPVRRNIVRPLIDTYRSEIEAYIEETKIPFRVDESNMDVNYSRNRIRHELIPMLEEHYNPQIKTALTRIADISSDQSHYLEVSAKEAINHISFQGKIDAALLLDLPKALQTQIIRSEICRIKGDLKDLSYEQVERVIEALKADGDFTITLPSGEIYAQRLGNAFQIFRKEPSHGIGKFEMYLEVPGKTYIPQIGISLESELIVNPVLQKLKSDEVILDADSIVGSLRVRSLMPGDKITPFGMRGSKKLQDVFVDKKIPQYLRAKAAIVADDKEILWVAGIISSERTRITENTKRAIRIVVTPAK